MIDPAEKQRLFDQIMDQTEEDFLRMARQCAPGGDAEDLYQDIVCGIWKGLDDFKGLSTPTTWAYGIAVNRTCAYKKKKFTRIELMRGFGRPERSVPEGGRSQEKILGEFVQSLPVKDRDIFVLFQADINYKEISNLVSISEVALRARIKRLKRKFIQRYL